MPSSPGKAPGTAADRRLASVAEAYAAASVAFACGDIESAARCVERAGELIAEASAVAGAVTDDALTQAGDEHARLLVAVTTECERTRNELARLRAGSRTLRSYGGRRRASATSRDA